MNAARVIGLVLLVLGVVLLGFGINAASSPTGEVTEAVTGQYPAGTMWYIIGGIAAAVAGIALLAYRRPLRT